MVSTIDECDGIMAKALSGRRRKKVALLLVSLLPFVCTFVCIVRLHKKLVGGDIKTYSDFFIHRHDTHIRGGGSSGGTSISFNRQQDIIDFNVDPLPRYAQDVIISLHKVEGSEGGGKGEKLCKGLLIRDDIILTSKECSTSSYVFHFPGVEEGRVRYDAKPYKNLNAKNEDMIPTSQLGFLETNLPYHYYFNDDNPVHRTRMFLSKRTGGDEQGKKVIMTCGERDQPIVHNFPVNGEMIPVASLIHILPEDILWDDVDKDTSPMLQEGSSHRWWTRAITLDDEAHAYSHFIKEYRDKAPPGALTFIHTDKFLEAAVVVNEAVDPRGHRISLLDTGCYMNYFIRYIHEKPFSGTHFFDWLDFGNGRVLTESIEWLKDENGTVPDNKQMFFDLCKKESLNKVKVRFFNDEERRESEVYITATREGLIARYTKTDEPVPRSAGNETTEVLDLPHLYVWDLDKKLYIVKDDWDTDSGSEKGGTKHTTILAGKPCLSAGKVYVGRGGVLFGINWSSGHYRPTLASLSMMYSWIKNEMNYNPLAMSWIGRRGWTSANCTAYDWNSIQGFEPNDLEKTCKEVTSSDKFIQSVDV